MSLLLKVAVVGTKPSEWNFFLTMNGMVMIQPPYMCHGGLAAKTSIGRTKKCSSLEPLPMEIIVE